MYPEQEVKVHWELGVFISLYQGREKARTDTDGLYGRNKQSNEGVGPRGHRHTPATLISRAVNMGRGRQQ